MTAAVIGASSESIYVINKAKELGLKVIALDGNPEAPGLKAADASFVVDIRDPQKVFEILDQNKPDIVLPVINIIFVVFLLMQQMYARINTSFIRYSRKKVLEMQNCT